MPKKVVTTIPVDVQEQILKQHRVIRKLQLKEEDAKNVLKTRRGERVEAQEALAVLLDEIADPPPLARGLDADET